MKLHTVVVSYERPELLERTIRSYCDTVTGDYHLCVVDNASGEDTKRVIRDLFQAGYIDTEVNLPQNMYPGYATNEGFSHAHLDARFLHRSDNDVEYKPGWCDEVARCFENPELWQLGLRTLGEEGPHPNVGGNMILRREAFEAGVRYSGQPWDKMPFEDTQLSHLVYKAGKQIGRVEASCIDHIGIASRDDPYYVETFRVRKITFDQYGIA